MSEYVFGVSRRKPTEMQRLEIEIIVSYHGVTFVEYDDPSEGYKSWFTGPNRGEPFDSQLAKAVYADLKESGLDSDNRGVLDED